MLLDEPTNHLDITAIEWLEEHLAGTKSRLRNYQPRPGDPEQIDPGNPLD